jgi:hypothetical protein
MAFAVDAVADVVEIAGHGGQFAQASRLIQLLQDLARGRTDEGGMAGSMLGKAEGAQVLIRVVNKSADLFVTL